jgi:glycosyltransferase involved in cell wall biosynthesis
MQCSRVLVINDYATAGGAEVVYQQSIDVLRATPGVDVQCFDINRNKLKESVLSKTWNVPAAKALADTLERYRPDRVLVHNYHNALSSSVLRVLSRYKRKLGFSAYLTCHDFYSVYYNSALMQYIGGHISVFPIDSLSTREAIFSRSSAGSLFYDIVKKMHWHAARFLGNPVQLFDAFFCPSPFMQQAVTRSGMSEAVFLPNPTATKQWTIRPQVARREKITLAFVGRIVPEKGLPQLLALAQSTSFAHIERLLVYGTGPAVIGLTQKFAPLIKSGKLIFKGTLPHGQLFDELERNADALIMPSVGAENAPLVIVEAAVLGLPIMVHDIGSLSTFGDEIGNKIKYRCEATSFNQALEALIAHLADPDREYDVRLYSLSFYARRLAQLMRLTEMDA